MSALVHYRVNSSITGAGGLGAWITGDGSGSLFVVRIYGQGTRDYLILIDFKGRRYVEIPSPQASWSDARMERLKAYKRWRGDAIGAIELGFISVPGNTSASVEIHDLRLLPEVKSEQVNPEFHFGSGNLTIQGTIPSDTYLWYKGAGDVELFDLNWNRLGSLSVVVENAAVPSGMSDVRVVNYSSNGDPWLECSFFVHDQAVHLTRE